MAASASAVLAVASCSAANLVHHAATVPQAPAKAHAPAKTTPAEHGPRIVATAVIRLRVEPESVASGDGSLWLAIRRGLARPGLLLRISARTLQVTGSWPTVGSPVGLAVSRRYVWVAGDAYDGRPPAYDANHVQQFTLQGTLVHSYQVPEPVALASTSDSAWVEYGGTGDQHVAVRQLQDGVAGLPIRLSAPDAPAGYATPLAACPGVLYAMSENDNTERTLIDRIAGGRKTGSVRIDDLGNSVVSCAPAGGAYVLVQDGTSDHIRQLVFGRYGAGRVVATAALPGYAHGLGSSSGAPWVGLDNSDVNGASDTAPGATVWQLSARTLRPGPKVPVRVSVALWAATARRLWTLGPASSGDQWVITELAVP